MLIAYVKERFLEACFLSTWLFVQTIAKEGPNNGKNQLGRPQPRRGCYSKLYLQEVSGELRNVLIFSDRDKWQAIGNTWVGQSSRYSDWLRAGRSGHRNPVGARFSAPVQTGPGTRPASCTMRAGSFPGVKSGRGVTLTPHPLLVPLVMKE